MSYFRLRAIYQVVTPTNDESALQLPREGTLDPGGDGPASAVAIVMALIAGVLAVVYTLVERKVNAE